MNRIGVLQGSYLGIYVNLVCTFWNYSPALNCRFCTTGENVGEHESADKAVSDVVETCRAAREESDVTFIHLNAGFQGTRGIQFAEPYIEAIKSEVGALVGAQLAPERDFSRYDRLIARGVDHVSFCLEFLDPEWFAKICPGKERVLGQRIFLESIEVLCEADAEGRGVRARSSPASNLSKRRCGRSMSLPTWVRSRQSASSGRRWARTWRSGRRPATRTCDG